MGTNDNIESFCSYVTGQIEAIDSIQPSDSIKPGDRQVPLYKRTLLVTLLDAMACIRFPRKYYPDLHKKNQERFTRFVQEYGDWNDGVLISVPFLFDAMHANKNYDSRLSNYLKEKLSHRDPKHGGPIRVDKMDERAKVLLSLATTEQEEKAVLRYQHYSILYRYRNYLVHEARKAGGASDSLRETNAHYQSSHLIESDEWRWDLSYPVELLKNLCYCCINNLKRYLSDAQIDPYGYDVLEDTSRF